jgi:nucleoside-diphosphate-sugar epimerase
MKEEYLFTGPLEPTNEGYALSKIVGLKMVEFYRKQYGVPWISIEISRIVIEYRAQILEDANGKRYSSLEIWVLPLFQFSLTTA